MSSVSDLASRLRYRVQMTSDGHPAFWKQSNPRLSNFFSRKIGHHMATVAVNDFAYNFVRIHSTLRMSPAMAAGVTDRLFGVSGSVALLVDFEANKAA